MSGPSSDRRYNLTLGANVRNVFNKVNLGNPSGVLGSPYFDQPEIAALAPIEDVHPRTARVHENQELPGRHLELQHRFVDKHRLDRITLGSHHGMLVVFVLLDGFGMQDLFFEVAHLVFARTMALQQARLCCPLTMQRVQLTFR